MDGRTRAGDITAVGDRPGLRVNHEDFAFALHAQAFADQLVLVHQHRNGQTLGLDLRGDGVTAIGER